MGYPSDLSDTEWRIINRLLPGSKPGGRPRTTDLRSVVNAIFYVLRSGCAWRMLPQDFPPFPTVYMYFKRGEMMGLGRGSMTCFATVFAVLKGAKRVPGQRLWIARA